MSEVCAKHVKTPAFIYGACIGCELEGLRAEAQALREEVAAEQKNLAFTEQWYAVRHERLWHWAHEELSEEQKRRYFNIVANGTAEHSEPPTFAQQLCRTKHRYECAEKEVAALRTKLAMSEDAAAKGYAARQQCGGMEMEIQELRAELAALRARVVVVPERDARRMDTEYPEAGTTASTNWHASTARRSARGCCGNCSTAMVSMAYSMRLVSNHDWHRIVGDHSAECVFLDSETMMVPAAKDQREIAVADWNARAVPAGHVVVSEGLLRRVCAEPPATCCMDDEMTWRRDLDSALLELRALLSEQEGGSNG